MKIIFVIIVLLSLHTPYVCGQDNQKHLVQLCQEGHIDEAHNFILKNYQLDSLNLVTAYLYGSILSKKFNSPNSDEIAVEYKKYLIRYIYDFLDIAHELEKQNIAIYFLASDLSKIYIEENNAELKNLYDKACVEITKCNHLNDDHFCVLTVRYFDYLVKNKNIQEAYRLCQNYIQQTENSEILYKACAFQLIGKCSKLKGKIKESIKHLNQSLNLYQQIKDSENFSNYYDVLVTLADAYLKDNDSSLSLKFAEQSLTASKEIFGEQSLQYIQSINLVTNSLILKHEYERASLLCEKAQALYKKLGINNNDIESHLHLNSKYLNNLLGNPQNDNYNQYSDKQDYYTSLFLSGERDKILNGLIELKGEYEMSANFNLDKYIKLISMISIIYQEKGDLTNWDNVLRSTDKYLEPRYKDLSDDFIYAPIIGSKGLLAFYLKNYNEAIRLFEKTKSLCEVNQDMGIDYIILLNNLAISYNEIGNTTYAKMIMDYSAELYNTKISNVAKLPTSNTITILNNIGYIYMSIGDYEKAVNVFNKVIDYSKENLTLVEDAKLAYNNLAYIYMKQHDYTRAYKIYSILCSQEKNKDRLNIYLQNKILTSYFLGKSNVYKDLEVYEGLLKSSIFDAFNHFSHNEREHIWTQYSRELLIVHNLFCYKENSSAYLKSSYNNLLFTKFMLLNSAKTLQLLAEMTDDNSIKEEYNKYHNLNDKIYSNNSTDIKNYTTITKERDEIEKSLISKIPSYSKDLIKQFPTWEDIRDRLADNEISIEFTLFPVLRDLDVIDVYYGALILKRGWSEPKLLQLGEQDALERICQVHQDNTNYIDYLYSEESPLFDILYAKILPYLKPNDIIYYSPCGILNKIKLGAMRYHGKPISDNYTFKRVSSTSILLKGSKEFTIKNCKSASIYGGINYNTFDTIMVKESRKYKNHNNTLNDTNHIRGKLKYRDSWIFLPGTLLEGNNVRNLLLRKNIDVTMYSGSAANEESFKAFSYNSPDLIHLATHGFCYSTNNDIHKNQYLKSFSQIRNKDNALQYTGLLLSGANNAWRNNKRIKGAEDGILTASEISNLNLSNTKLVVLSACDTGLGDIDIVDGVIGLQKALKKAGVETIMMSLWKVDDKVTNQFMSEFYKEILNNKSPYNALKKAEFIIRQEYPNPFYWASFVILD